jgi:outer membrane protein
MRIVVSHSSFRFSLQNSIERIEVTETSFEQAEESLKVTRDRYLEEIGTNTEVLIAQTLLTNSRSNYYSAVQEAALARVMLDRAAYCSGRSAGFRDRRNVSCFLAYRRRDNIKPTPFP